MVTHESEYVLDFAFAWIAPHWRFFWRSFSRRMLATAQAMHESLAGFERAILMDEMRRRKMFKLQRDAALRTWISFRT
jgi:hypothetical protein